MSAQVRPGRDIHSTANALDVVVPDGPESSPQLSFSVRFRALRKVRVRSSGFPYRDQYARVAHQRVGLHFIPPGGPWRNGCIESFSARVRDECLNINIFWNLTQARVVITDWKEDCNHRRRHSALGYQAPAVYAASCTAGDLRAD